MTDHLHRRTVLAAGTANALLFAYSPAAARQACPPLTHSVVRLFHRSDDTALIARDFLERHPDEADSDRLLALVFRECLDETRRAAARGDHASVETQIARAIQRDLRAARVFVSQGWVFAQSEARLCCVATLEGPA